MHPLLSVGRRLFPSICRNVANRTCLYDFHLSHDAKMVDFGGWEMPLHYGNWSIGQSTCHTRKNVSLFDVSHMLQTKIIGRDREDFMESLTPADIHGLPPNHGTLSVLTNDNGGIRDDLIVTKTDEDHLYLVTNAGCIDKDLPYLQAMAEEWRKNGKNVDVEPLHGRGLIAVQGPEMVKLLQPETDIDLSRLYFMHSSVAKVAGIEHCRITRCGYTGEDGVEISVAKEKAAELADKLLSCATTSVKLAGLGARDALRLEAGLCLYGNELNDRTTPVEAALTFVVAHLPIVDLNDNSTVGFVTSGCPSPTLNQNISMAYVDKAYTKIGTEIGVDFGVKTTKVVVSKIPFVPVHYHVSN